jgi:hypothetical protein
MSDYDTKRLGGSATALAAWHARVGERCACGRVLLLLEGPRCDECVESGALARGRDIYQAYRDDSARWAEHERNVSSVPTRAGAGEFAIDLATGEVVEAARVRGCRKRTG